MYIPCCGGKILRHCFILHVLPVLVFIIETYHLELGVISAKKQCSPTVYPNHWGSMHYSFPGPTGLSCWYDPRSHLLKSPPAFDMVSSVSNNCSWRTWWEVQVLLGQRIEQLSFSFYIFSPGRESKVFFEEKTKLSLKTLLIGQSNGHCSLTNVQQSIQLETLAAVRSRLLKTWGRASSSE